MPALDDVEGARVPPGLPPVVDAHVHLFDDRLANAIRGWFDQHGWPIRYRQDAQTLVDFLAARGIDHMIALHYSHVPGLARTMNQFMAGIVAKNPRVTGVATVLPGEPDAVAILEEAFTLGLHGVKLHCHVQCFAPDEPRLGPIYELCAARGEPIVMHAGREPKSPALRCDPYELCSADRIDRVLREHPQLKLCVPHLGCDEVDAYARLLDRHENLWLDTAMTLADYLPDAWAPFSTTLALLARRPERILYGTDFPNIPFSWDRELRRLASLELPAGALERIVSRNARELFGL